MDELISIVIPMYNAKKTVRTCLNSIRAQTYKNWKAIVINDGSTDGCDKICKDLAKKDPRIVVVDQENQGSVAARKNGIALVEETGYFTFCDSDDTLAPDALEKFYSAAKKYDCDLVSGSCTRCIKAGSLFIPVSKPDSGEIQVFDHNQIMEKLYPCYFGFTGFTPTLCMKLFRAKTMKNYFFQTDAFKPKFFGDDLYVMIRLLPNVNRCVIIPDSIYNYTLGGNTSRFMPSYLDDSILLYQLKMHFGEKYDLSDYFRQLTRLELKNSCIGYLQMCIRNNRYPNGSLEAETKLLLNNPIIRDGISGIQKERLAKDFSELVGFTDAFWNGDAERIAELIRAEHQEKSRLSYKLRRIISKIKR